MNRTRIHWLEEDCLPEGGMIVEAVPGVGNVGKIVVDALVAKHPSRTVGWILHPDFPPHATLGEDGLIGPPRLDIKTILLGDGSTMVAVTGIMQPMTAAGQYEVAESILDLANQSKAKLLLVLAGLASEPDCRAIHVICSDRKLRGVLEKDDIEVSNDQPNQGMIGVAGMVLSLSTTLGVPSVGVVAETMGASSDVLAADRMSKWIEQAFEVPLDLDLDTTKETAARLMDEIGVEGSLEDYLGIEEQEASADFYV
ncbi:MAG: hypothetical protein CMA88_01305 [Euryarchaeota archaeon]|nr:hypothetical protein [Euryarchaeota archaeon]